MAIDMNSSSRPSVSATICREPYRLFFPLGIFMAIIGTSHWLFYALGFMEHYSGFFHSSVQTLTYMNCFIIGFLLTAMPRFSGSPQATPSEVCFFVFFMLGILIFLGLKQWVIAEGLYIVWLLGLVRFAVSRVKKKTADASAGNAPQEMIWIPLGVVIGIFGTILLILGQLKVFSPWAILVGKPMMEQGFLLSVVLGIGGFLVPRLMGTYQPVQDPQRVRGHLIAGGLLFLSFWIEGLGQDVLGYGLRAAVITAELTWARAWPLWPRSSDLYVRLVYCSVWMIVIGFWLSAFFPAYRIAALHIAYIGGFSLLTFAIGTMVVLSHAGEGEKLHGPLWILWIVVLGIAMALFKRAAVVFAPDAYFRFLGMSATFWLIAGGSWLIFILPRIFKVPTEDEFGRMHEKAKERRSMRKN